MHRMFCCERGCASGDDGPHINNDNSRVADDNNNNSGTTRHPVWPC